MNEIVQIKYLEDVHYEIIQISLNNGTIIDIGFLNIEKFNMFDRLLFLQKNMAKSTTTKLFENQLIKDIYQEYDSTWGEWWVRIYLLYNLWCFGEEGKLEVDR